MIKHLITLSLILLFCNTAFNQTLEQLQEELNTTYNIQDKAYMLNKVGVELRNTGQLDKAIDKHIEALNIYKELSDIQGQATSLNYLGGVYWRTGDFDQAIQQYSNALQLSYNFV